MVWLDQCEVSRALPLLCVSSVIEGKLARSVYGSAIRLRGTVGRGAAPKSILVVDSGANR